MPSRDELIASWARTERHLRQAREMLPEPPAEGPDATGSVDAFNEYLDHNELELALDALEMLGDGNSVRTEFWRELLAAAENMALSKHAVRYRARIASLG